jgi:hypothetical protein
VYRLQPVFSEPPEGGTPTIAHTQTFLEPQYLEERITNCDELNPTTSDIAIILKLLRNLFQLLGALPRTFLNDFYIITIVMRSTLFSILEFYAPLRLNYSIFPNSCHQGKFSVGITQSL